MANEMNDPEFAQAAGMLLMMMNDEEEEQYQILIAAARLAAGEIMEMEEGLDWFGYENVWVPVTVFINEYHAFGDATFKLHFRMTRTLFETLVTVVHTHLVQGGKLRRERTPFQDAMLMVLWLLATPDTFRSVSLRFGVAPSSLYYHYSYIIEALRELAAEFIRWPGPEERQNIQAAFARASGFPGIVGCIDGTHINISAPLVNKGQYVNRHHSYSMNVQAVVDHNLTVRHLYVGEVGSMNDNRVFRRSPLYRDLLNNVPAVINPDEHLVGDGAYTLTGFMLIPFPNNGHLTERQLMFNRRLSQCRVRVENAFAYGKGKWRRLKYLHSRRPDIVVDHIIASFVLHNFLIREGERMLDEDELARPIANDQILGNEDEELVDDPEEQEEEAVEDEDRIRQEVAEANGEEKRLFIMDNVLHMDLD